ncbi:MAG: 1-(5-phosphoribosyl)-5-[(5-phosphoribosylamino)methylideneamino]imidazole-4-carboxamide isomerase [Deltaproteobacteria bacterium]|nr:MAG: 1-(5-phosphoribosyl)-5-[(5-phosphoribosylamino)methylideneamino]imidazole-4-carboxamide isomerase [Deltaproteobacteria bacterium]
MKVIPAIDLLGGRAVRLRAGRRDDVTVFSDEPWRVARAFAQAGAERIHVVDLDGAFDGAPRHRAAIERILAEATVPVQVGGGLRTRAAIDAALAAGAAYAVVGTAALTDPDMLREACAAHPGRIVVAVDARDGRVAIEGWVETSDTTAVDLGRRAAAWGAAALLYTDVARDGLHRGPNVDATAELAAAVDIPVIASGGVSSVDDLRALAARGIPYAVVGRALYEGRFTLEEAIAAAC